MNPSPRPVRPKNCCSKGVLLDNILNIICRINIIVRAASSLSFLSLYKYFKFSKTLGSIYIPRANSKTNFGMIKESLLNIGVSANVTNTAKYSITSKLKFFSSCFTSLLY